MASAYNKTGSDPAARIAKDLKKSFENRKDVPDDVISAVDKMVDLMDKKEEYLEDVVTKPSDKLRQVWEETFSRDWQAAFDRGDTSWKVNPRMSSNPIEAQFLKNLMIGGGTKRVLEVGSFCGYGAMAMAEALPPDGVVVALEYCPYFEKIIKQNFEGTGLESKLKVMVGPALESMAELIRTNQSFDFIFIDADKDNYPNYYKTIMDSCLLAKGGVIAIDNVLWGGTAYSGEDRSGTDAIRRTNEMVRDDTRAHHILVPLRDGIMLVRRKSDYGAALL